MAPLDRSNASIATLQPVTLEQSQAQAVVIGAGLGGLAAAMRLGSKGYRVTLLDRLDVPGGRGSAIWQDGYRFDLGPTIVTVPHVFRELWTACGRDFDHDVDLRPLNPYYEIRWLDGSTFTASADRERMFEEVKQLSPDDLRGYQRFMRDGKIRYEFGFENLGRRSMHELWQLIKVLPTFARLRADQSVYRRAALRVKDERLRMALSFHPLFIGGDPFRVTSVYALVNHLETEFGVHYAMGGIVAMAQAMAEIIRDQGGTILLNAEVDEIIVKDDRAAGVALTDGTPIPADIVVSNADAAHTYGRLLRGHRKRRWTERRLRRTRWSMGLFVWYFGTKSTRRKWPDVGHHTIVNGPRYKGLVDDIFINGELADDMSLYVHRPTVTDASAAPDGDDTFYALSPVPHLGHDRPIDWSQMAEVYRERVQSFLNQRLLPGLNQHLNSSLVFTPETFRDRYRSWHGSGFSLEPRIFQSAWFRPHNVSEELSGLYMVGSSTHPGAGLPGVIATAEVLANLVPDANLVMS